MTDQIIQQITDLDIPYPQKRLLKLEVQQDLLFGVSNIVEKNLRLSDETLDDLRQVHATKIHLFLRRFARLRCRIEMFTAFIPLITGVIFIFKEEAMLDFIREGGTPVIYAILVVGLMLLGRELLNVFRLIVVKDHSTRNLEIDTSSVLLGCLGLLFVAIGQTALGLYKSAEAVTQTQASYNLLVMGAKDSLAPMVLGSLLCALIVDGSAFNPVLESI
jgi:hypothetical protein